MLQNMIGQTIKDKIMPKPIGKNMSKTVTYSNLNELKQQIKNLDTHTVKWKKGRAFSGIDSYFEWSKETLGLISKNDHFLSLFAPEIERMLINLEKIRAIYADHDEEHARELAHDLEWDVGDTLRGIEKVQRKYRENRDIHDFIELAASIEKDIQLLKTDETKHLEKIRGINIVHEDIIEIIVNGQYEKADLDSFYEVVEEAYPVDLKKEYGKYIEKQWLQNECQTIQQKISELDMVFPRLKLFAQENAHEEQEQQQDSSFKFR